MEKIPDFTTITHPTFQSPWLLPSIQMLFERLGDRLTRVVIALEVNKHEYNDDGSYDCVGSLYLHGNRGPLSEDELDTIPAVRKLERLAENLWDVIPVEPDDEGTLSDSINAVFERTQATISIMGDWGETDLIEARCVYDEQTGQWDACDIYEGIGSDIPESDILTNDPKSLLEYFADDRDFLASAEPIKIERQDDGSLRFSFNPGALFKASAVQSYDKAA